MVGNDFNLVIYGDLACFGIERLLERVYTPLTNVGYARRNGRGNDVYHFTTETTVFQIYIRQA
jgi:hypothetical protein